MKDETLYHESSLAVKQQRFNDLIAKGMEELMADFEEQNQIIVQQTMLIASLEEEVWKLQGRLDRLERGI